MPWLSLLIVFVVGVLSIGIMTYPEVNVKIMLHSIAQAESNNRPGAVGASGERSEYQFLQETWEQYSSVPFYKIGDPGQHEEVQRVAKKHLKTIELSLLERKWEVNPYNIALMWNGGTGRKTYLRCHADYAKKVERFYATGLK